MADTFQQWLGRFPIDSSSNEFTVDEAVVGGAQTVTLTSGNYYISGYTGESTDQLAEHITTTLQAANAVYAADTCTYSASTGKVTFTFANATNIVWSDTGLRDILGFTASDTVTSGTSYTGSNEARYVWRPNVSFSDHPVTLQSLLSPMSSTTVFRSRDGTITTAEGSLTEDGTVGYTMLDEARVIIPSSGSVNKELEKFFEDVIHAGEKIRLYWDRSVNTSTDYMDVVVGEGDSQIGRFTDFAARHIENYNGLWDVDIPLLKVQ